MFLGIFLKYAFKDIHIFEVRLKIVDCHLGCFNIFSDVSKVLKVLKKFPPSTDPLVHTSQGFQDDQKIENQCIIIHSRKRPYSN